MYRSKPIMNVCKWSDSCDDTYGEFQEESAREVELFKMSPGNLELPVKMLMYRKVKCKFKTTVGL